MKVALKQLITNPPLTGTTRVLPFDTQYPRKLAASTLINKLKSLPQTWTGNFYNGEAEYFMFGPFYDMLTQLYNRRQGINGSNKTTALEDVQIGDSLSQKFFSESIDYSIISEIVETQQAKSAASDLQFSSIADQPLIRTMIQMSPSSTEVFNNLKSSPDGAEALRIELLKIMPSIGFELINAMAEVSYKKAIEPPSSTTMQSKYQGVLMNLKKGKGAVASRVVRDVILAQRMEVVRILIDLLSPTAGQIPSVITEATEYDFADGYVGSLFFLEYLKQIQDYDSYWPYQPFQSTPAAYVLSIMSFTSDLAAMWMTHANDAVIFDLDTSINIYEAALHPYEPLLDLYHPTWRSEQSAYDEIVRPWHDNVPDYTKIWWSEACSRLKAFSEGAELVMDLIGVDTSIKDSIQKAATRNPDINMTWSESDNAWLRDGKLISVDDMEFPFLPPSHIGERISYSPAIKVTHSRKTSLQILTIMKDVGEALITSVKLMLQTANVINLANSRPLWVPKKSAITSSDWTFLPLVGTLKSGAIAPFGPVDPCSRIFTPWYTHQTNHDIKVRWKLEPLMWRVLDYPFINQKLQNDVADIFYWQDTVFPQDDATSYAFTQAVLPFCYTKNRRRIFNYYSINQWISSVSTMPGYHDDRGILASAAITIDQLEDEMADNVLNALAANILVYKLINERWQLLLPKVPALYGVPRTTFIENQKHGKNNLNLSSSEMEKLTKADLAVVITLSDRIKGNSQWAFVLHDRFPAPRKTEILLWEVKPRLHIKISIFSDFISPSDPCLLAPDWADSAKFRGSADKPVRWLEPGGWSDLVITWPHINAECIPLTPAWENWQLYQLTDVFLLHEPITGDFMYRAVSSSDAYLLDEDDRIAALSVPDPDLNTVSIPIEPYKLESLLPKSSATMLSPEPEPKAMAHRATPLDWEKDLAKTLISPLFALSEDGKVEISGGIVTPKDLAESIFAGEVYETENGIIKSNTPIDNATLITPENAEEVLSNIILKAKKKKGNKAKNSNDNKENDKDESKKQDDLSDGNQEVEGD